MVFSKIQAKSISYGGARSRKDIRYIVIHYTGNKGDTARGNGLFFKYGNERQAGAHWFVDKEGKIVRSIPMTRTAWSVGGLFTKQNGAGNYYHICTNANSVSIELCDLMAAPSAKQRRAVKELVEYIREKCPYASTIIRHWDVNGKECPAPFIGTKNASWQSFKEFIS